MGERRTITIIGVSITLVVGLLLVWAFAGNDSSSANVTPVTDKAAIAKSVQVSGIGILTGENYVGHKIRVIRGTIRNVSDKPLRMADVNMVFHDFDGKPIQESVQKAFDVTQKPLLPGTQIRFEVNFENLPKTWNYHIPDVDVVKIGF